LGIKSENGFNLVTKIHRKYIKQVTKIHRKYIKQEPDKWIFCQHVPCMLQLL